MKLREVIDWYSNISGKEKNKYSQLNKTIFNIGTLRLVIVLAGIAAIYFLWNDTLYVVSIAIVTTVAFCTLLVFHNRLYKRRLYSEIQVKNAENELKGIGYDFSAFDGAPEKINSEHAFSYDLDIFGNRSFFQSLNRTVTSFGKDFLADAVLSPLTDKTEIVKRQEAVKELAKNPKFLIHFRTIGEMSDPDNFNLKDFSGLVSEKPYFYKNKVWTTSTYLIPALYIIFLLLYAGDIIAGTAFIPLWIGTLIFSSIPMKWSMKIYGIFDKKTTTLEKYSRLFEIIENEEFDSALLNECKESLGNHIKASEAISQLKSYHNNLGISATFPVILFFNPVLLWNVRYALKIEKWLKVHHEDIKQWFDAIAAFDALVSMGIFTFNRPDYTYPEISKNFVFKGKALGHPMIKREVCVRNDINMPYDPYFLVVTGANMAGKSTYLRTVALNHVLACTGMPVCAESLVCCPNRLVTNLRTTDSLADNESYFFSELKRLKMIIDRLQEGEELFIILDEILKGTNSEDKQKGSLALMRQLVKLNGTGIIATHDLELGKLENEFPENVKDYCFEAEIKNDQLSFSYRIKEGVAQNMNACFLMEKMGITGL